MTKAQTHEALGLVSILAFIAMFITMFAAWITHVIVTIGAGAWGLLIAGAIVFPIGIIHGVGLWFGAW
jgi:hypothetical protein